MEDFKFTIEFLEYNEKGGGVYSIDMSDGVAHALIERGVVAILQDYIKEKGYPPFLENDKEKDTTPPVHD